MLTDLTATERALVDAARLGEEWLCSHLDVEELKDSTDAGHLVRARLLRELLLGWHGDLDPRGVRLIGARITEEFDVNHVEAGVGLLLEQCVVDQKAQFRDAQLPWLTLTGCILPALHADGLQVDGDLSLEDKCVATGSEDGAIRLSGARISGDLDLSEAQLANENGGAALYADRLRVDGSLILGGGFVAIGSGEEGVVRLLDTHIGVDLDLNGAQLTNTDDGPVLFADRLRINGNLFLNGTFVGSGAAWGVVRLLAAHISGILDIHATQLINNDGPVLVVINARCAALALSAAVVCPAGRCDVRRACPDSGRVIGIAGFTYTDLSYVSWKQWLHLLRCHTAAYQPQPYQQLAAVRTAAGHDRDTRRILIVQQQDHRGRGDIGGRLRRAMHAVWGGLGGYGYRTGRIALTLLAVLLLAGGLGVWAGNTPTTNGQHAAQRPPQTTNQTPQDNPPENSSPAPAQCSLVELIGLGIDRGLPLASTGVRARCDLDAASTAGQWFTAAIWLLQAAVWALATLAIAGYTGLVRKIR